MSTISVKRIYEAVISARFPEKRHHAIPTDGFRHERDARCPCFPRMQEEAPLLYVHNAIVRS